MNQQEFNTYETLLDCSNQQISVHDAETFELLYANNVAKSAWGRPNEDYSGKTCYEFFMGKNERCTVCPHNYLQPGKDEQTIEIKSGERTLSIAMKKVEWKGRPAYIEYLMDVSLLNTANEKYQQIMELIKTQGRDTFGSFKLNLTKNTFEVVTINNDDGNDILSGVRTVDELLVFLSNLSSNQTPQGRHEEDFSREVLLKTFEDGQDRVDFEECCATPRGNRWTRITVQMTRNPITFDVEAVFYATDIHEDMQRLKESEFKRNQAELLAREEDEKNSRLSYLEPRFNCLNHNGFVQIANQIINNENKENYVILSCDVAYMSRYNAKYGREAGDEVIRALARDLAFFRKEKELVAYDGADKFLVLMEMIMTDGASSGTRAQMMQERYRTIKQRFIEIQPGDMKLSLHTGAYVIMPGDKDKLGVEDMIEYAYNAHKTAKELKSNDIVFYNSDAWDKYTRNAELPHMLDMAIENGEIQPYFQCQYSMKHNSFIGAEVLCRWNSKRYGFLSPAEFIPVLEKSGQIIKLDEFIWESTCKILRGWMDEGYAGAMPLSINISRIDFLAGDVSEKLISLVEKYKIPAEILRLEITESAFVENEKIMLEEMNKLHDYGFILEIDDFGSGYSSLNILHSMPVDVLKLDMRFLQYMEDNAKGRDILKYVISMANAIGLEVVAEGVETHEQADNLYELGCEIMQGYLFSKPLPYEALIGVDEVARSNCL